MSSLCRRTRSSLMILLVAACLLMALAPSSSTSPMLAASAEATPSPTLLPAFHLVDLTGLNIIQQWMRVALLCVKGEFPFMMPVVVARCGLGVSRAMFDVSVFFRDDWQLQMDYQPWDATSSLSTLPRFPPGLRTEANYKEAISYAVFAVLSSDFVSRASALTSIRNHMSLTLGYDISTAALSDLDLSTPRGLGNAIGAALVKARQRDGFNELADEPGTKVGGAAFSDYTGYVPVNPPQDSPSTATCSAVRSQNKWQPLRVPKPDGTTGVQVAAGPHVGHGRPFALKHGAQFRPPPPPMLGTNTEAQFLSGLAEVIDLQANLTDANKALAEYWADGPDSTLPPGHWLSITLQLAEARSSSLHETVFQLLAVSGALYDAGIACWDAKFAYDSARPLTAVQCIAGAGGQSGWRWAGPYRGVQFLPLSGWVPYQNKFFVTPAFAEYVSGHSSFSYAAAKVLRTYWNNDFLGYSYTVAAGSSLFEPKRVSGQAGFVAGVTDVPNSGKNTVGYSPAADVLISFPTLTAAAESAGYSRRLGGIHFRAGDMEGRALGDKVGAEVMKKMTLLRQVASVTSGGGVCAPPRAPAPTVNINFAQMFAGVNVNGAQGIAPPTVN